MDVMSTLNRLNQALDARFNGTEGLQELEDITKHGMAGGVGGFIYSTELAEFFDEHENAIEETLTDMDIRLEDLVKDQTSWTFQEVKERSVWIVVEEYATFRVAQELLSPGTHERLQELVSVSA